MWQRIKNIYHLLTAIFAACFYGFPGHKLKVIGVTGTDGKTTTVHLIHHILKAAGKKASLVSSVYAEIAGEKYDTGFHVTTPDPWKLQKFLRQSVDEGDHYLILEVTSHGLDQNRVWGIPIAVGVLTNVSHEHLDYHKSFVNYVLTKKKLLEQAKSAIINHDDISFQFLSKLNTGKIVTYGIKDSAQVTPANFPFTTSLPGEYNLYNCLAAIAVCRTLGIEDKIIKNALRTFSGVKGRFEYFQTQKNFDVIIDFAHTPNALEKILSTLKPIVNGRLIHVFGAAGLRDVTKRPIMGKMSAKYADLIVITEEDNRTENLNEIIEQIAQGCRKGGAIELAEVNYKDAHKTHTPIFFRIPQRQVAINFAVRQLAHNGDAVILTGKGHEQSLCRGTVEYPWNEQKAVKQALKYK